MPDGAAHNARFGHSGALKQRLLPNSRLQAGGGLKNAAFALHFTQAMFAADIGHVFAEDQYALVAAHLFSQRGD